MMQQRGRDVRGAKTFFEEAFDEMILPFEVGALQCRAEFVEKYICTGVFDFADRGRFAALNLRLREALDVVDLKHLASGHERNRASAASSASRATDAMQIILH